MIYEYRCTEHRWTLFRSVDDRHDQALCPACSEEGHLVICPTPVIFKVRGFPGHDIKGKAFHRVNGRNMSFGEREFLDREASDDASAVPDTVRDVSRRGDTHTWVTPEGKPNYTEI